MPNQLDEPPLHHTSTTYHIKRTFYVSQPSCIIETCSCDSASLVILWVQPTRSSQHQQSTQPCCLLSPGLQARHSSPSVESAHFPGSDGGCAKHDAVWPRHLECAEASGKPSTHPKQWHSDPTYTRHR